MVRYTNGCPADIVSTKNMRTPTSVRLTAFAFCSYTVFETVGVEVGQG